MANDSPNNVILMAGRNGKSPKRADRHGRNHQPPPVAEPEEYQSFTDLLNGGQHLFVPTGSDLSKYGKVGTPLAAAPHGDLNFMSVPGKTNAPGTVLSEADVDLLVAQAAGEGGSFAVRMDVRNLRAIEDIMAVRFVGNTIYVTVSMRTSYDPRKPVITPREHWFSSLTCMMREAGTGAEIIVPIMGVCLEKETDDGHDFTMFTEDVPECGAPLAERVDLDGPFCLVTPVMAGLEAVLPLRDLLSPPSQT